MDPTLGEWSTPLSSVSLSCRQRLISKDQSPLNSSLSKKKPYFSCIWKLERFLYGCLAVSLCYSYDLAELGNIYTKIHSAPKIAFRRLLVHGLFLQTHNDIFMTPCDHAIIRLLLLDAADVFAVNLSTVSEDDYLSSVRLRRERLTKAQMTYWQKETKVWDCTL